MTETIKQTWNTEVYNKNTRFVSVYGEGVVELLAPQAGERILDLGCGDGALTIKLKEAGVDVVGADASDNFVEAARALGLDVHLIDAHALNFDTEFDAVFSNAALHWMLEPTKVIDGVVRALKPGGRFVGEFGGYGNVAAITTALRAVGEAMDGDPLLAGPWFFPTVEQYQEMLEAAGFRVDAITTFYRPTPLPTDIRGWLETMRRPFFEQFGARQEEAYERVIRALEPSLRDYKGNWIADYVRLRFAATL
ncbi:MAG: methyltransferase domain-containing protein [Pseudomonadota bacterium]